MVDTSKLPPAPPPPPDLHWSDQTPPAAPPPWYRRPGPIIALVVVLLVGIGLVVWALTRDSSGGGPDEASNLPKPAAGMATVGGTVTVNGTAAAGEDVSLAVNGKKKVETKTAADGSYLFKDVAPGTYSLTVSVYVKDASTEQQGLGGLDWDMPCSASGFRVLNAPMSDKTSGEPAGVIAVADNNGSGEAQPFTLDGGDRLEQNVAFRCVTS